MTDRIIYKKIEDTLDYIDFDVNGFIVRVTDSDERIVATYQDIVETVMYHCHQSGRDDEHINNALLATFGSILNKISSRDTLFNRIRKFQGGTSGVYPYNKELEQ